MNATADRRLEGARRPAEEISTAGDEAIGVACDVADLDACEAAAARRPAPLARRRGLVRAPSAF